MIDPKPVHLKTTDEVRAEGWLAEARDADGHLLAVISPDADDASLGQFLRECTAGGMTVTSFPSAPLKMDRSMINEAPIPMGIFDSKTGESIDSIKVVGVSDLQTGSKYAALIFGAAARGRIVQLRLSEDEDIESGRRIHYFFDEPASIEMIREDEDRFGFKPGVLLNAITASAPAA